MRNYRNAVAALALVLVLTTPTFAGIMYPEKPTPPPPSTSSMTTDDVTSTDAASRSNTEGDAATANTSVTEAALTLLQSVLSLF